MPKGRESDMPALDLWESFFDPGAVLESLGCRDVRGDLVEFGCGYGSFTVAAAPRVAGTLYALDIEPAMVALTQARVAEAALHNVIVEQRDLIADGCGRPDASAQFVLLFNLLHIDDPVPLLREAHRVLGARGALGVIHWKRDANTPRGPSLDIRPSPVQCRAWGEQAGFRWARDQVLPGTPWHWGMVLERP